MFFLDGSKKICLVLRFGVNGLVLCAGLVCSSLIVNGGAAEAAASRNSARASKVSLSKTVSCEQVFLAADGTLTGGAPAARMALVAEANKSAANPRSATKTGNPKSSEVSGENLAYSTIADIYSGNQLYSVRRNSDAKVAPGYDAAGPGIFQSVHGKWKLLLPEVVRTDERGNPEITQLSLSQNRPANYAIAILDDKIVLFTSDTDPSRPESRLVFGSKDQPLFEVGSGQKRYLNGEVTPFTNVAVYQDPVLSGKGSQVVIVSLKFAHHQSAGDGLTFAFEVKPMDAKVAEVKSPEGKSGNVTPGPSQSSLLNGRPVVLDYEYHPSPKLHEFVVGDETKLLFSKILLEKFQNQDLSGFAGHMQTVYEAIVAFANKILMSMNLSGFAADLPEKIAYDITNGKVIDQVSFEVLIATSRSFKVKQIFHPSISSAKLEIWGPGYAQYLFGVPGKIDLKANNNPAFWTFGTYGSTILYVVDGDAYLSYYLENQYHQIKLGAFAKLFAGHELTEFPESVSLAITLPQGDLLKSGAILISAKMADGDGFTTAIRYDQFADHTLVHGEPFALNQFFIPETVLNRRISLAKGGALIFDIETPDVESDAGYAQAYDLSRPHVNLSQSDSGDVKYIFNKPLKVSRLATGLTYAEFSITPGVSDPSGVYFGLQADEVTGNESTRIVGTLLTNPRAVIKRRIPNSKNDSGTELEDLDVKKHTLAETVHSWGSKSDDDFEYMSSLHEEVGSSANSGKLMLLAVDPYRKEGREGHTLALAIPKKDGSYHVRQIILGTHLTRDIESFYSAGFIRGRKVNKDLYYLLIAFKAGDEATTYALKIDMSKDPDRPGTVERIHLDKSALSLSDLKDRIGFDEDGSPSLIMTPELAPEAYQFAIFDFKVLKRAFPNQDFSGKRKKIKYGEWKGGQSESEAYVRYEDSWTMNFDALKKKWPDIGRSKDLVNFESFVELGNDLDAMANPSLEPKRMILVVPQALRELVWDFILAKGFGSSANKGPGIYPLRTVAAKTDKNYFSVSRIDLDLYLYQPERSNQNQFIANLDFYAKMRETHPENRKFLLVRLDELLTVGSGYPPPGSDNPFTIQDVGLTSPTNGDLSSIGAATREKVPHGLYLLGAGGPIGLKEFRANKPKAAASMIILATPEELKATERTAGVEIENGLLSQFQIKEIRDPDTESMTESLSGIFENSDVQSMEFKFSAKEIKAKAVLSDKESLDVVIAYAVSRFSFLQEQRKDSRFEAFMRFRKAFAASILTDKEVRRSRIVNKYFVERVLTQVFDIPMNLATLPADDPMRVLSAPDALLKLQEAGYSGPFDLKAKVRDTIVSQTRADAGKPVPSSIMLFGNTGAGKTFMFKSLVKMLGLKMYDFNDANGSIDAQAIIINVGQVLEKDGSNRAGSMDVQQVLEHLDNFLSNPNGYRGWILIDDVHAAPDAVKAKILSYLRNVFESQDGLLRTSRGSRRPIRNLNIFMTLNPTADQDQIARYAHDKLNPTSEEVLLATLSTSAFKVEPSFLRRWGRIINLDYMPAGAKGPELIRSMARASNTLLNTHNRIALVDPLVVSSLVRDNEKVDARSFLSASTSALIEAGANDQKGGSLVMVVPSMHRSPISSGALDVGGDANASEKIIKWVGRNTRTLSLDASVEGNLIFLKLIVDAYRIPVFESLIMALQEDRRFTADPMSEKNLLIPTLAAISDHLSEHGYVSLHDLDVSASQYGLRTSSEREHFRNLIDQLAVPGAGPLYPSQFRALDSVVSTWEDVFVSSSIRSRSRRDILAELIQLNRIALHTRMSNLMRVQDVDTLPDPTEWVSHLKPADEFDTKLIGRSLVSNMWSYLPQIYSDQAAAPGQPQLSTYAATRLFLYSIDRAMVLLPWVNSSKFLLSSLSAITQDQVLSQKPGVQSFLFGDSQRLIKPSITDFAFQILASANLFESIPATAREKMRRDFSSEFDSYLAPTK
jgi:hypothetical protein